MADWTCRCGAKNADGDRYCEGCGAENTKAPVRHLAPVPKPAEGYTPAHLPTYPAPKPGDDALIRAEIARARALLGMTPPGERPASDARLPAVDPAIRAEVARRSAGPVPIGDLLDNERKGAGR